jgi:DNA-binding NarL/FixJ family response regulator
MRSGGELPVDKALAVEVLHRLAFGQVSPPCPRLIAPAPTQADGAADLSERECEVLAQLASGKTNRQIAEALVVTPHTVKSHLEHIFTKLGVRDRTQAAVRAIELGSICKTPA